MPLEQDRDLSFEGFEWDENKNRSNARKHGIDFADALPVFSDPDAVVFESKRPSREARHLVVGRVAEMFVTVVFTLRGECIRIISARHARKSERKRYGQ